MLSTSETLRPRWTRTMAWPLTLTLRGVELHVSRISNIAPSQKCMRPKNAFCRIAHIQIGPPKNASPNCTCPKSPATSQKRLQHIGAELHISNNCTGRRMDSCSDFLRLCGIRFYRNAIIQGAKRPPNKLGRAHGVAGKPSTNNAQAKMKIGRRTKSFRRKAESCQNVCLFLIF